jgi:hypothetical protein
MSTVQEERKALFEKAVERASLAPSVHNTQPWRLWFDPMCWSCTRRMIDGLERWTPLAVKW